MLNQPFGHQAEAVRAIRSQILMRTQGDKGQRRPLAVCSPDSGDGKTYFCANLAVALAQLGGKVVVIDADMRGARLDQVFGVTGGAGLSGVLSGRGVKGIVKSVPGIPNLYVIPVGVQPPNPDWGVMLSENQTGIPQGYPLPALAAGICIVVVVVAFNVLGERLFAEVDR